MTLVKILGDSKGNTNVVCPRLQHPSPEEMFVSKIKDLVYRHFGLPLVEVNLLIITICNTYITIGH
jgi:hypothetical protein